MVLSNIKIYGIEDSIKASKYPMSVDVAECSTEITDTIKKLAGSNIGSGHDNFLNGIIAQFDLKFTNKTWVEAERYHFFDFVSSQSTMHRITRFNLDKSYCEYVDPEIIIIMKRLVTEYNENPTTENYLKVLYSNPAGFYITARMTTNYRQLKTIYHQRKTHRLPEWREFCKQLEGFPYSGFIIGERNVSECKD